MQDVLEDEHPLQEASQGLHKCVVIFPKLLPKHL